MTINNFTPKIFTRKNYKIVIAGDGAVGKTTFSQRLAGTLKEEEDRFMTCGIDFHSLKIIDDDPIFGQIWDLGGQEHFRIFQEPFFDSAQVIILLFSVDYYPSFLNLMGWLSIIQNYEPFKIYLIANKIDSENRAVSEEEGQEFAINNKMEYYEVSALRGKGFLNFKNDLIKTIKTIFSFE